MTHNTLRRTRINTVDIVNGTRIDLSIDEDEHIQEAKKLAK